MSRSKCARCGKLGRWARDCKNPPDERVRQRAGVVGFMIGTPNSRFEDRQGCAPTLMNSSSFVKGHELSDELCFTSISYSYPEGEIDSFIGLTVTPGLALVDTGAQHGVIGPNGFEQLRGVLAQYGLKPRKIETLKMRATGVGGSSDFIFSVEVPIATKGISGLLVLHGVEMEIPCLLPVELLDSLGMILNLPENNIYWKYIDRVSGLHRIGPGPHLAVNICEFPEGGWKNPYEAHNDDILGDKPLQIVPRSAFEVSAQANRSRLAWVAPSPIHVNLDAGSARQSRAQHFDLKQADREYEIRCGRERRACLVGITDSCEMAESGLIDK